MLAFKYIKDRIIFFIGFFISVCLVALFFYLYDLPWDAAFDIICWQSLIALCFLIFDAYRWNKKHKELEIVIKESETQLLPLLKPDSQIEEDYQMLAAALDEKLRENISKTDGNMSEMSEYYMLWAHQVKVPLSAINLMLQADSESQINDKLHAETSKIEHYIEMLLNYHRLESMSSDLLIKPYDVKSIANDAVKKYKDSFIGKKIAVEIELEDMEVITDRKWFSFILEQLISNSLKYTNEGKISILKNPSKMNSLLVKDTGIGIREEDLPRIWERGFTGYNGRLQQKASGLGLYMCKKIADRLSVELSITSDYGKGTTVEITFPESPYKTVR